MDELEFGLETFRDFITNIDNPIMQVSSQTGDVYAINGENIQSAAVMYPASLANAVSVTPTLRSSSTYFEGVHGRQDFKLEALPDGRLFQRSPQLSMIIIKHSVVASEQGIYTNSSRTI